MSHAPTLTKKTAPRNASTDTLLKLGLLFLHTLVCLLIFGTKPFLPLTYLINPLPTRVIDNASPVERLFGSKPDYTMLKSFRCACLPHLRPYNGRKLAFRSKECIFVGYSSHHKGYKCLDASTGRVYISRDVIFDETVFPFAHKIQATLAPAKPTPPTYHQLIALPYLDPVPQPSGSNNQTNDLIADVHYVSFGPDAGSAATLDSDVG